MKINRNTQYFLVFSINFKSTVLGSRRIKVAFLSGSIRHRPMYLEDISQQWMTWIDTRGGSQIQIFTTDRVDDKKCSLSTCIASYCTWTWSVENRHHTPDAVSNDGPAHAHVDRTRSLEKRSSGGIPTRINAQREDGESGGGAVNVALYSSLRWRGSKFKCLETEEGLCRSTAEGRGGGRRKETRRIRRHR